jgi:hypothetical protein
VGWVVGYKILCLQFVGGRDGLQIWSVSVNMFNKQFMTVEKRWFSSLGTTPGANKSFISRKYYRWILCDHLENKK